MPDESDPRIEIAKLQVQVEHLTEAVSELRKQNRDLSFKVDQIRELLTQARGGWKAMLLFGGAMATLGSAASWLVAHFPWRH